MAIERGLAFSLPGHLVLSKIGARAMRLTRLLTLVTALAIGAELLTAAADESEDLKAAILKLAAALEKNDKVAAKNLVDQIKKQDLDEVMGLMKSPKVNKAAFDLAKEGIELKLVALSKKAGDVKANAETYEKIAKVVAAIAEVAAVKCPVDKPVAGRDPKDWAKWVSDMKEGAKALGDAANSKDTQKVNAAAKKTTGACISCHDVFRR
jgi:cytochrome c'